MEGGYLGGCGSTATDVAFCSSSVAPHDRQGRRGRPRECNPNTLSPENDNENITPDDDEDEDIAPEDMIDNSGDLGGMTEGVGP